MPLVSYSDFEDLPEEPIARWLQLRDLVERRLDATLDFQRDTSLDKQVGHETSDLLEYVAVLSSAADELGVGRLDKLAPANIHSAFQSFRADVAGLATALSLRTTTPSFSTSVALQRSTKTQIFNQIERLRKMVAEAELPTGHKSKLSKKLDELQNLVASSRTDIAKVGLVLAVIGALASDATSFLADAPNAIGTISALIGSDKLDEEEEQKLLEDRERPLAIPDMRVDPSDDDVIPF